MNKTELRAYVAERLEGLEHRNMLRAQERDFRNKHNKIWRYRREGKLDELERAEQILNCMAIPLQKDYAFGVEKLILPTGSALYYSPKRKLIGYTS